MNIYIAMSGGVDSSVAAALLKEQGHSVTGVTMRLLDETPIAGAERAAELVGVPHMVVDFRDRFGACVIDGYTKTYAVGLTPNPCVVCNNEIKFGALLDYALKNGADRLATGHYARITEVNSKPITENREVEKTKTRFTVHGSRLTQYRLLKGLDAKKDQSYFLYGFSQERLRHIVFPLGEMTKNDVREKARQLGLPQAVHEESQDVCFSVEMPSEPGEITNRSGQVIGIHKGITGMTIGQRKGLGIAAEQPLYVLKIDAPNNRIIAGPRNEGYRASIEAVDVSWIAGGPPASDFRTGARIRYNAPEVPASIAITGDHTAKIVFDKPQFAPAPGQSVVFYSGDEILGGAIISKISTEIV